MPLLVDRDSSQSLQGKMGAVIGLKKSAEAISERLPPSFPQKNAVGIGFSGNRPAAISEKNSQWCCYESRLERVRGEAQFFEGVQGVGSAAGSRITHWCEAGGKIEKVKLTTVNFKMNDGEQRR